MKSLFLAWFLLAFHFVMLGQQPYVFQHLGVEDGINDGHVHVIGQDKYGYIWFASLGALCRYDGYSISTYTGSVPGLSNLSQNLITCFHCTNKGRFFLGSEKGLYEYEYETDTYHRIRGTDSLMVNKMVSFGDGILYLATNKGLGFFDLYSNDFHFFQHKSIRQPIENMSWHKPYLFLSSNSSILRFHTQTKQVVQLNLNNSNHYETGSSAYDKEGHLWFSYFGSNAIYRLKSASSIIDSFPIYTYKNHPNQVVYDQIFCDKENRIWVLSKEKSVFQFNRITNQFEEFRIDLENGLHGSDHKFLCFFEGQEGNIWLSGRMGIVYFKPKLPWIETIKPFIGKDTAGINQVSRVSMEDHDGNLWLGTLNGLVRIDHATGEHTVFNKTAPPPYRIAANAIRGIACDSLNNLWIATGNGMHYYDSKMKTMKQLTEVDSFPVKNFICARLDGEGFIWTGSTNPKEIYRIDPVKRKILSISLLPFPASFRNKGIWSMFQDSQKRYWFGTFDDGLFMYDPDKKTSRVWRASDHCDSCIAGNSVIDIREDHHGVIWLSTFHGVSSIDMKKNKVRSYNSSNGLLSNTCSGLVVDPLDRIWICSGRGLMMLDSQRKYFTDFSRYDGLPSLEFPQEYPAYITKNNQVIMGSKEGFIRFNPLNYHPEKPYGHILLQFFRVNDSVVHGHELNEVERIRLKSDENFFTIGFAAINYGHSNNIHYAYKLEGVNDEWVYTDQRYAEYTHIEGGDYVFHCKAGSAVDLEHATEKILYIHIDTPFYKTIWFKVFVLFVIMLVIFTVYRYRMKQRETVLQLKSQAYLLEKEKVQVMYENLKQHLNPHFLFNSLTSLGSLIRSDQQLAGKFLDNISKVYRYILKNRENELVTLADEIRFVSMYIDLQKTRFGNGLDVQIELTEEDDYYKIAPVTLQNLVENAIKHNIANEEEPLIIRMFIEDDYLYVQNNLQRKQFVESSNKQGLSGMISLYRFLTDRPFVVMEDETFFTVKIPLL